MLRNEYERGANAALARFGLKTAEAPVAAAAKGVGGWLGGIGRGLFGHPEKLLDKAQYAPGGMYHWKNVMWPTMPGKPLATWASRGLGTILPAYGIYKTLSGENSDPSKGRLESALGSAGNALGWAYGFPAAGLVGAPYLGQAGQRIGEGVGRFLDGPKHEQPGMPQGGNY